MARASSPPGSPLAAPRAGRLLRLLALSAAMAAVLLGARLVIGQGLEFVVCHVTLDDSYYFLNTAWHTRQLGWVTFDGVNPTNGVQFLWFWLLWLYSFLFDSRESFLVGALWLCAALGAVSVWTAWRIGTLLRGWRGAAAMAGCVAYAVTAVDYLRVLENTVHLAVFLLAVEQYLRLLHDRAAPAPRSVLWLAVLLSLNAWCRLDAAVISAVLGLHAGWVVWRGRQAERGRRLALAAVAVCGVAGAVQLVGYRLMGGSLLPVSGLWKTGSVAFGEVPSLLWQWWGRPLAQMLPSASIWPAWVGAVLAFALAGWVVLRPRLRRWSRATEHTATDPGLGVVLVALALHTACMLVMVDAVALRRGFWYQAPYAATMAMLVTVTLVPPRAPGDRGALDVRWSDVLLFVLLAWLLVGGVCERVDFVARRVERTNFHGERLQIARWIDANLEPDARLAAFNSGELGYFSNRSVTNLDGLINSYAYLQYRRDGGEVADYLVRERIDFFVDYLSDPRIAQQTELVRSWPIPKVSPIELRRVLRPAGDGR